MQVFIQHLRHGYDERSILSQAQLVWIQNIPSPRLIARSRLKNPVSRWKNKWISAFLNDISAKRNAKSFVQDLNSARRAYFLQWRLLYCEILLHICKYVNIIMKEDTGDLRILVFNWYSAITISYLSWTYKYIIDTEKMKVAYC